MAIIAAFNVGFTF